MVHLIKQASLRPDHRFGVKFPANGQFRTVDKSVTCRRFHVKCRTDPYFHVALATLRPLARFSENPLGSGPVCWLRSG